MSAKIYRFSDYHRPVEHNRANDLNDALNRWETAAYCGNVAAMLRAQCDYFSALFGDWPAGDKPCDTE
jgi:hypothetical protein